MKTIAALAAGMLLSLTTFVTGIAITLAFLNADEPAHRLDTANTASLWTSAPEIVNRDTQSFKRIPTRVPEEKIASINTDANRPKQVRNNASVTDSDHLALDSVAADRQADAALEMQVVAHQEWCAQKYRSYDAATNTYRPYGGGRRDCSSPYSDAAAGTLPTTAGETAMLQQASFHEDATIHPANDHRQSCQERYRSYRVSDNTYQPYYGGGRRQCQ